MLRENLLQNRAAAARFISLADNGADGVAALGRALDAIPRPFSAVVLGMADAAAKRGPLSSAEDARTRVGRLADLAAGRPVQMAETTPYGCSVKY